MFGFPIGNGNAGFNDFVEKFTNNADSGFPKIQQREVFYSIRDGSWDDAQTWQTASGRVGLLPTASDNVYVRHTLTMANNYTVNNLYNTGYLLVQAASRTLTINGNFINYSSFYWTSGSSSVTVFGSIISYGLLNITGYTLELYGDYNYIEKNKFTAGTGTVAYYRPDNQVVLDLQYNNLFIYGSGTKTLQNDLVINGNFDVRPIQKSGPQYTYLNFDIGDFDFTVNGTSYIGGTLIRRTTKKILFIGRVTFQSFSPQMAIEFNGNPEVEFRGGINVTGANIAIPMNSGTGKWRFTTNNQTLAMNTTAILNLDAQVEIEDGITVTQTAGVTQFNNTVNGISATSKLVNQATLRFATAASVPSMTTGQWDFTTSANTIEYAGNYSATIPSYFTNFHNLTISGTGTKTLGVNTTLNGNLSCASSGILECSTYNLNVLGTTTLASSGSLLKSGGGSILFTGLLTVNFGTTLNLSGNPSIESRGGINNNSANFIVGSTNTWTFTTNNQTITTNTGNITFYNAIISGAISVTNLTGATAIIINNTINGDNASSTLINQGNLYFNSTATSMTTGVFTYTSATNVIGFIMNANYTIPYTTFQGLRITGTGIKTLSGNTTVGTTLFISSPTASDIFELSNYDLTVTGATTWQGVIKKSGAGAITFIGAVTGSGANCKMNLSGGNPTVEIRNGISTTVTSFVDGSGTGTGQWSFTTNNQTIALSNNQNVMNCPILISGAITLTYTGTTHIFKGLINGNNASSKLLMGTGTPSLNYQNATQPMATGILDTSTNLNTWIYGNGNQDIKGSPTTSPKQVYRNLTLNGGGTKTLQGYVSVQNTYTLTAPATLALNGYTLTNP